ncbi:MAG: RNA polymerase sigma factor [Bryobacteraceae bacterium]
MAAFQMSEELVGILRQEGAASGLQTQVAQLFEEAREDVYRYLMTLGLTPSRAQDATQEVFLRLYAALKGGEEIENPRAWVFRVAHNWGLKVRAAHAPENAFDADLESRLAAPANNAEDDLLERERMLRFHRTVESLSEQQKRCLFLRMEGLRYPEIAAAMGISASAVGEFLRRAMERLKKVRDE